MLPGSSEALREGAGWEAGGVPGGRRIRKVHSGALEGGFGEAGCQQCPGLLGGQRRLGWKKAIGRLLVTSEESSSAGVGATVELGVGGS